MSTYAIRAEGLSKRYRIEAVGHRRRRRRRLVDSFSLAMRGWIESRAARRKQEPVGTLWALRDLDFEIHHGDPVGIIGANGAGKTTLLKILARITAPTEGKARLRGRIGSLLEVGTGFHSELTGRENVYLNGAVLGMRRREIGRKFDAIVDFSGVENFIETPLKFYSSGMRMRLAFSVAAHLEPEILLVDEVLAVGDMAFQNKCLDKMQEVTNEGRTVLFVSHNLGAVKSLCPRSMLLDHGQLKFMGDTTTALEKYVEERETASTNAPPRAVPGRSSILGISTWDASGAGTRRFPHDEPVHCRISVSLDEAGFKAFLTLKIYGANMETILASHDFERGGTSLLPSEPGTYTFDVRVPGGLLIPGRYFLGAELARPRSQARLRRLSSLEHVAEFEVYDNGSVFSRFNFPWQGLVHSDSVSWTRLNAGESSAATVEKEG